ncbi:DUF6882 domain-containing protein [Gordonia sp. DT30]|uniref:DUF6882 domain-containing protein n=1 Tax=Gordonia sp. DT30 TaxID=3416546 RepID=UPI003CEF830D
MSLDGLRAVADCGAWYAELRRTALQHHLTRELGEYTCNIVGTAAVFTAIDDPLRQIRAHRSPVASVGDPGRAGATIRWAWAAPDPDLPADLRVAELRRAGERLNVAELLAPELPLPCPPESLAPNVIAATIGAVAVQLTGAGPDLRVDRADGGFDVIMVTGLALPEPTFADLVAALPTLLDAVPVGDHRVALHGVAVRLGWHVVWQRIPEVGIDAGEVSHCVVTDGSSEISLSFDVNGQPLDAQPPHRDRALPA